MMFLLNNMDINQEGQLSSEDRLFSSGTPRYQSPQSQVGVWVSGVGSLLLFQLKVNPFGAVRWEGGRPIYSAQVKLILPVFRFW